VDSSEPRARARQEADELGPEPPDTEAELWREERWGVVVLPAGLAEDDAELLRQAATASAAISAATRLATAAGSAPSALAMLFSRVLNANAGRLALGDAHAQPSRSVLTPSG
jgi:hypothetical protein